MVGQTKCRLSYLGLRLPGITPPGSFLRTKFELRHKFIEGSFIPTGYMKGKAR